MGVIDLKFNDDGNSKLLFIILPSELAVSSLDSHLRVWNLDEGTKISEIKCNPSFF